jgi:hypothetical protein
VASGADTCHESGLHESDWRESDWKEPQRKQRQLDDIIAEDAQHGGTRTCRARAQAARRW